MEILNDDRRMRLDRIQSIFKLHELGEQNRAIARMCNCSASTISDTLNLYKHPEEEIWAAMSCYERAKYVWDKMKARARAKKRFKGKIRDRVKRDYVEDKLINQEWSPEIISSKIKEELGKSIAVNTVYRYIKSNGGRLKKHLWEKGKARRQRVAHRRGRFKKKEFIDKKYIDQRPEIINSREEFGHWEGDLMLGPKKGSGYVILSLIERKSRKKIFIRMPNAKAETTLGYLRGFFKGLPEYARKSITFDNGSEFSVFLMHKLEKEFPNFKVYYTETYSPQQKGSDEHSNGRFRRAFPKKTDFSFVSKEQIKHEETKLNNRPMKLHSYKAPQDMFDLELKTAALPLAA